MRLIRLAIVNVNPTVGAVRSNTDRALRLALATATDGATVACLPELVLAGYPPEDLVQWRSFVDAQRRELVRFVDATRHVPTVFVVGAVAAVGGQLFNTAAVAHRGVILGFVPKEKLPTYNVFYEARTFSRGGPGLALDAGDGVPLGDLIFAFDFGALAVEVCEDAWSADGPMRRRCYTGAELVVNISASPFRVGVVATRREMLATRSADNQTTLAYVNKVGGQDALVCDGGGYVFQTGRLVLDAPRFREGVATVVVDLDSTRRLRAENTTWRTDCEAFRREPPAVRVIHAAGSTSDGAALPYPAPAGGQFFLPPAAATARSPRDEALDDLYEALALGLKDYFEKTGAFRTFGIALSGGRDSLLALLVAWRAVQLRAAGDAADEMVRQRVGEEITAFYMPTRFSTPQPRAAAELICQELGVSLRVVSIDDAFERELAATKEMLGCASEPTPITHQNIQARLRSLRMWDWANSAGGLFLQTSDMSERAVGYTTIGGDLEGGISVIANLPKTVVVALLERLHARFGLEGIARTLATEPSPELAADQSAESELMPFPILDACLHLFAAEKLSLDELAAALPSVFPTVPADRLREHAERFVRLFTSEIYKWVQSPLGIHVGSLELDRERALQLPVVESREWLERR